MMIGTCRIENNTIITSKTTYVVTQETRPDVRRIFLAPSLVGVAGRCARRVDFFVVKRLGEIGENQYHRPEWEELPYS